VSETACAINAGCHLDRVGTITLATSATSTCGRRLEDGDRVVATTDAPSIERLDSYEPLQRVALPLPNPTAAKTRDRKANDA